MPTFKNLEIFRKPGKKRVATLILALNYTKLLSKQEGKPLNARRFKSFNKSFKSHT